MKDREGGKHGDSFGSCASNCFVLNDVRVRHRMAANVPCNFWIFISLAFLLRPVLSLPFSVSSVSVLFIFFLPRRFRRSRRFSTVHATTVKIQLSKKICPFAPFIPLLASVLCLGLTPFTCFLYMYIFIFIYLHTYISVVYVYIHMYSTCVCRFSCVICIYIYSYYIYMYIHGRIVNN